MRDWPSMSMSDPKGSKPSKSAKAPSSPRIERADDRLRDAVLDDFRKIVGPLRGRNRDQTPKS